MTIPSFQIINASGKEQPRVNAVAITLFTIFLLVSTIGTVLMAVNEVNIILTSVYFTATMLIALLLMFGVKVADQWEKGVVLRLGKYRGLYGPGLYWITPIIDRVVEWIDHRVMVSPFSAEKTLTKDTVPVDVDAVLFWMVWDAEKAAMEVENYRTAITWAAQTALR